MPGANAALRLALSLALCAGAPAFAQDSALREALLSGVSCTGGGQADDMLLNADRLAIDSATVNLELIRIEVDASLCLAIQNAAGVVSETLAARTEDEQARVLRLARGRLEEALREADARAAAASFEVGPPPRNVTRLAGQGD